MRILALTNLYPNPYQPHRAPFNRQQFRALAALHPVRVISPIAWTDELRGRRRRNAVRLPQDRRVMIDGIHVEHPRYLFPPMILRFTYGRLFRDCVEVAFNRALAEFAPDIVLAAWAYPDGFAAVELARSANLPVVIKVHGSDVLLLDEHPSRRKRTINALRTANGVITVSQDLARHVINLGVDPARTAIICNGVDTSLFRPGSAQLARQRLGLDSEEPIVLYVGNLVTIKGVKTLLNACAALRRGALRFRCYLVGGGPLEAPLRRQIRRLRLQDCVTLAGVRPHAQLPDWYRAASAVVLPGESEGIPNVLLEAMSCGTPFIATDVGGVGEVADNGTGQVLPPGDFAALVDAIRHALAKRPLVNPSRTFKPHTWGQSARLLAQFLEQHVNDPRNRKAA